MVEIEEIENDGAKPEKATSDNAKTVSKNGKTYRKRIPKKDLPSVAHLLAHGSPESQGRPKTFCDVFGYPIFVTVCFAISLLIFHYAPHDKSVQPKGKFSTPRRQHQQQYRPIVPDASVKDTVPPPGEETVDKERQAGNDGAGDTVANGEF